MTRVVYIGSLGVNVLLMLILMFCLIVLHEQSAIYRFIGCVAVLMYLLLIGYMIKIRKKHTSAWLLIILYAVVAILIFYLGGINTPVGILILGFVVILSGIMLGPKYIMWVTIGAILLLATLQILGLVGLIKEGHPILNDRTVLGEVVGNAIIFIIFALVVWLSGISVEKTLVRAAAAERELQKERDSLKNRLEIQKNIVDKVRQKELKQLYKFAELGQLTTIILHDLANYLSILTLDIDDIEERHQSSIAIKHAKESIFYIDTIIDQFRNQINDSDNVKKFNVLITIKESLKQLQKKLNHPNIQLLVEDSKLKSYLIFGDPLRLSQAITILVTNAVQANINKQDQIFITVQSSSSSVLISVKDFGTGITKEVRQTIFEPKASKKEAGLGIGLFVTKQIIETHFKGKIWLDPSIKYSQFNIQIPRMKK